MSDVSVNSSVLVISPLNSYSIVKEQVMDIIQHGISTVHLDPNKKECLIYVEERKFKIIFSSVEYCLVNLKSCVKELHMFISMWDDISFSLEVRTEEAKF